MSETLYARDFDSAQSVFEDHDLLSLCALYASGTNESFAITNGNDTLSCPFILDPNRAATTGRPSLLPMPHHDGPGDLRMRRAMMNEFITRATSLADRVELRISPTVSMRDEDLRPFIEQRFEVKTDLTSIVDLTNSAEALNRAMRKSYPGAVKRVARDFAVEHLTGSGARTSDVLAQWLDLYAKISHRTDHPQIDQINEMTRRLVEREVFHLFYVCLDGVLTSGAIIACNRVHAYYWQGATCPDFQGNAPFAHALLWRSLLELKSRSVRFLETGQVFTDPSDAKGAAISFFKLGVGGRVCPWLTLNWSKNSNAA